MTIASTGSAADFVKISQQVVSGSSTTKVSFTSIPGTYRHLKIVINARGTGVALEKLVCQINTDTGANYSTTYQYNSGVSSTPSGGGDLGATGLFLGYISNAQEAAGVSGSYNIIIPNYSQTVFNKTFTCAATFDYNTIVTPFVWNSAGQWNSTAAITQLDFITDAGLAFFAGSTLSLYGMS